MADFVTLTCPACGGKLQLTSEIERFACGHCGLEHIVKRGGGIVSLHAVEEGLARIHTGVDKTASELAISRLEAEIPKLETEFKLKGFDLENSSGPGKSLKPIGVGFLLTSLIIVIIALSGIADTPALICPIAVTTFFGLLLYFLPAPKGTYEERLAEKVRLENLLSSKKTGLDHHRETVSKLK